VILRIFAEQYGWTPEQVAPLSYGQIEMYLTDVDDLKRRHVHEYATKEQRARREARIAQVRADYAAAGLTADIEL
jgi:hypothetical protein